MSAKKPGFVVYHANEPIVETLNLRQRGELLTALFEYSTEGKHTPCKGTVEAVFQVMKSGMDKDKEKYEKICEQNKKRIQKRWNKKAPDTERDGAGDGEDTEERGRDTEEYGEDTDLYGNDTEKYGEDTETIRNDTKLNRYETEYEIEIETETETEYEIETETETETDASYGHTHTKRDALTEKRRETGKTVVTGETGVCARARAREEELFDSFWNLYPRKSEPKEEARKVFLFRGFDENTFGKLMESLKTALSSPQWHLENGRYIPKASVWLREHRDEPVVFPEVTQKPRKTEAELAEEEMYEMLRKNYLNEMEKEKEKETMCRTP